MVKSLKKNQYIIIIVLFFSLGWFIVHSVFYREESMSPLEFALRMAKNNRTELEKVLYHYQANPADSLKYKAACFLIENMPFYTYSEGEQLENYKSYFAWLKNRQGKTPAQIADSVKKVFGPMGQLHKKCDIFEVDSAYLCDNIEWAFKVWREQPWGKNISFKMFCEYILPYRIDDEPLSNWREKYYKKYSPLLDSLKNSDIVNKEDPVVAAEYIRNKISEEGYFYTSVIPFSFGHIGPEHVQSLSGSCREVTDFGIYLFRALGIPCTIDFLPIRSCVNAGHFWLSTWDANGEEYISDFLQTLELARNSWWYKPDDSGKVYRTTFSINRKLFNEIAAFGEDVYPLWRLPKFIDVTRQYAYYYKEELKIPASRIYPEKRKGKIAYLCFSSRDNWVPIDWTEYDKDNLIFCNLKKGAVMRIATYEDGFLKFVTDPFHVDKQTNEIHYYSCENERQTVTLYSKYNVDEADDALFRGRLLGGIIEGSNRADFLEKDTLYEIQRRPYHLNTVVKSWSDKKYRYVRYVGHHDTHCSIAELTFYTKDDTTALQGKCMGTPGCFQKDGSHEYPNVFDGKTWTCFDYSEPTGGWAGLDLGKETQIDKIMYTPSNRDNYVRPGDTYELFYCDREWKSAGIVRTTTDSLIYDNIPRNALLLLRNYTRGVEERIFVYENGSQIWK